MYRRVSVGTPPTVSFNVATDSGNTIYTKYTPTKTVTITAQFSESLMSTPTLSISGLVTSVIMTPISATNSYTYLWNTSTPTIPAGDYFISASGRNNLGIYNTGVTSYTVTVSPTFYLDSNGVTIKCQNCSAGDTGMVGGTLYTAVENGNGTNGIQRLVNAGNYNLVTTLVTDMSSLFQNKNSFNTDIGSWDTSNVTNMQYMFNEANAFNQNLNSWDVSSVTNMQRV